MRLAAVLTLLIAAGYAGYTVPDHPAYAESPDYLTDVAANQAAANLGERVFPAIQNSPHFGGMIITTGGLEFETVGDASPIETAVTSVETAAVPVTYKSVPRSYSSLVAETKVIDADQGYLSQHGITLTSWGPDEVSDSVLIRVQTYTDSVKQALVARYGSIVTVYPGDVSASASYSRTDDSSPWWGGDELDNNGYCTSWFEIENIDVGHYYDFTAGHCGAGDWYNDGHLVGSVASTHIYWTNGGNSDVEYVNLISNSAGPYVWSDPDTPYRAVVSVDPTRPPVHTLVCTDGVTDREVCDVSTIQYDVSVTYDGKTIIDQTYANSSHNAFSPGDSGGPVYRLVSGGVEAEGMVVAHWTNNSAYGWYTPVSIVMTHFSSADKLIF